MNYYRCVEEIINKTNCPQCQTSLKHRWLSQEEQEKLVFNDVSEQKLRNGSQLSQVEVYFCPSCAWQSPSLLCKDNFEDIPFYWKAAKISKGAWHNWKVSC